MARARILCISLSPINRDARVLRQLSVLKEFGDVTTVGYGGQPADSVDHIAVPSALASLPQTIRGVANLVLRQWQRAELLAPAIGHALVALHGSKFDLVVANDARVLALAHRVAQGAPVWADLHEWAPEERTHVMSWRLLVAPLMVHLCAKYLPRSAAVTTVGAEIAKLYQRRFGVNAKVMRNSSPWQDLSPGELIPGRIRLVHSGGAVHGRSLETMIGVVRRLDARYTLDLYLVPGGDGGRYLAELKRQASGCDRIRFRDPVRPDQLASTLNSYDVGVFWIPPTHTNARLTLPNKFFDYVQARLAVAVGPTIEMSTLVQEYGLGVVADGFTVDDCERSIHSLSPAALVNAKRASDAASRTLSFEADAEVARDILRKLLPTAEHRHGLG